MNSSQHTTGPALGAEAFQPGPQYLRKSAAEHSDVIVPVFCVCDEPGGKLWFSTQLEALGATVWEPAGPQRSDFTQPQQLDAWVAQAAAAMRAAPESPAVHVVATGSAAFGAISLAAEHPDLIMSLILGDPRVGDIANWEQRLREVQAPTVVIAAEHGRPEPDQAQSIAGQIDNGVFVIIDDCEPFAHRERPESFTEWASAFMGIAEGLYRFNNGLQ